MLGSNVSGHSADDYCLVYNYYSGVPNPTGCTGTPGAATSGNNGNVMGHYYQDGKYPTWGHTLAYTYDSLNRLSSALAKDLSSATLWNPTFSYDRWGNMSCSGSGLCTSVSYSTANNNRLASVATHTASYDAAGDLTGDGTQTYQWDAEGHLTQVYNSVTGTTSTFTYNALGQRVGKVRTNPVGNFEYVFDPAGQEAGEFNSNSCCHYWDTRYFRVGGRLLGEYFGGSNTFFIHTTALGSTNQVTDQAGIVQEDTLLYPWGQPWKQGGASYDNHFAGFQLRDTNVSADPTPNRWYTYGVGRWPSPDPAGKGAVRLDDPQTWNMYAYVRNNPTTLTDPSGECAEDLCIVEGSAAIYVGGAALLAGTAAYLSTPSGQRSLSTFTSAAGQSISNSIASIKGFFSKATPAPRDTPAPGSDAGTASRPGTLGKPDHQETVKEEAARVGGRSEVPIDTPGGLKDSRRADAVGTNPETGAPEVVQVYRPTAAGNIPKRERDAAADIENETGVKPTMVPVRPLKKCPPSSSCP
jgi:RHS repeat-associated protein